MKLKVNLHTLFLCVFSPVIKDEKAGNFAGTLRPDLPRKGANHCARQPINVVDKTNLSLQHYVLLCYYFCSYRTM